MYLSKYVSAVEVVEKGAPQGPKPWQAVAGVGGVHRDHRLHDLALHEPEAAGQEHARKGAPPVYGLGVLCMI